MTGPNPNRKLTLQEAAARFLRERAAAEQKRKQTQAALNAQPDPFDVLRKAQPQSETAAQQRAIATGVPQPVTDRLGKILYYVDYSGGVVPRQIAEEQIASYKRHPYGSTEAILHPDQARTDAQSGPPLTPAQEQQKANDAVKLGGLNQAHGWVWINGHLTQVTGYTKDGTPIVSVSGGKSQKPKPGPDGVTYGTSVPDLTGGNSAWGALPSSIQSSIPNSGALFNLSAGPANIFTGQSNSGDGFGTPGTAYTPAGVGMTPAAAEHSQSAETVTGAIYDGSGHVTGHAPVQNRMTVADGVQWFLNLSVQHPDQYRQLVQMLRAAHYITDMTGNAADGGYGFDAAGGFARATAELASVNNTAGGAGIGLYDFLHQKAAAAQSSAAGAVQPVTRNFQDPATLRYAARQAAQSMLGRDLTPAEEQAFEGSYRGQENRYYNNLDATNQAQASAGVMNKRGPANTVAAPDATGEADAYVRGDQFADQRAGYSMLEYLKSFENFIRGGSL